MENLLILTNISSKLDVALWAAVTLVFAVSWIRAIATSAKSHDRKRALATCGMATIAMAVVCLYEFGAVTLYDKISSCQITEAISFGMVTAIGFIALMWGAVIYNIARYLKKMSENPGSKNLGYLLLTVLISLPTLSWITWLIASKMQGC